MQLEHGETMYSIEHGKASAETEKGFLKSDKGTALMAADPSANGVNIGENIGENSQSEIFKRIRLYITHICRGRVIHFLLVSVPVWPMDSVWLQR